MENTNDPAFEQYKIKRDALLKEANDLKFGDLNFSSDDLAANEIFEHIRKQTRQKIPTKFHFQAVKYRKDIESSQLYEIFQKMPKGSLQHIHIGFYLPSKWYIEHTIQPNVYVDSAGKIAIFEEPPADGWKSILKMREEANDKQDFDKRLEDLFHMTVEEMNGENVWQPFQFKIANRLTISNRKGFWRKYILDCYLYAIEEGFNNLQVRTYAPSTKEEPIAAIDEDIDLYRDCLEEARKKNPNFTIGIIFVGLRFWQLNSIDKFLEVAQELKKRHSDIVIGYDFVAEEKLRPALDLASLFLKYEKKGQEEKIDLPPIFHAGESLEAENTNLYDICLLKSRRIGHAINLFKHPYLYSKVKEQNICVEVNPMSNQILQYVADLRLHPAIGYHNYGIKISLSSDDPGLFQTNIFWDYFAAAISFEFTLLDFKRVIVNSIETACMSSEKQSIIYEDWQIKWNLFVKELIANYK